MSSPVCSPCNSLIPASCPSSRRHWLRSKREAIRKPWHGSARSSAASRGRSRSCAWKQAEEIVRSDKVLSKLTEDQKRHLRSEAEVMALLEPEFTLHALPKLLAKKEDTGTGDVNSGMGTDP